MGTLIRQVSIALCILLFTACSSTPKTELELYTETTKTFGYKTYAGFSKVTVNPSLYLYNSQVEDTPDAAIRPELVHAYAAVVFALSQQNKWALAEANLALSSSEDDTGRYLSYSALSIALYSNGWPGLAQEYAAKAKQLDTDATFDETYKDSRMTAKFILGVSAIYQGDGESAESLFLELGDATDKQWLPVAAHGAALIMDSGFSTPDKLKELATREELSLPAQEKLLELTAIAEQGQDNPGQAKAKTGDLVARWSKDSLAALGNIVVDKTMQLGETLLGFLART